MKRSQVTSVAVTSKQPATLRPVFFLRVRSYQPTLTYTEVLQNKCACESPQEREYEREVQR